VKLGVLLIGMGGPDSLDDVEPYLANVRHGRPFSKEFLADLKSKYALIGGRSPLIDESRAQAAALELELRARGIDARVEPGMRYWKPYVADALGRLLDDGVEHVVALCLTPQESTWSTGGYRSSFDDAVARLRPGLPRQFVKSWHLEPGFLDALCGRVGEALARFAHPAQVRAVFTAHSLPTRFAEPYVGQLQATAEAVSRTLSIAPTRLAFQSATATGEPWLGPDVGAALDELAANRTRDVLLVPIGFIAEHLEILYDLDILYADRAKKLGLRLERAPVVGSHPALIRCWADLVAKALPEKIAQS
jgi:protoporphyrin/coproporphyrin ferrochelatase